MSHATVDRSGATKSATAASSVATRWMRRGDDMDDPGGARTHDLRLKRPLLYRLSYRVACSIALGSVTNLARGDPCSVPVPASR